MKIKIAIATAVIGLSGCANVDQSRDAIATSLFGPARDSDQDITRMSELAWPKHQAGLSIDAACSEASNQLKLRSRNPSYRYGKCNMELREKAQAERGRKSQEDADRARLAQAQRRTQEFERQISSIRAGRSEIYTKREAAVIYEASDGQHLASRPLVRPDSKKYVISGFVDAAGGLQANHFLMRSDEHGDRRYAYVYFRSGASLPPAAHAESQLFIVGNYIGNKSYDTTFGEQRSMPVFQAEFVKVLN